MVDRTKIGYRFRIAGVVTAALLLAGLAAAPAQAGQFQAGQFQAGQVQAGQVQAGQVQAGQVPVGETAERHGGGFTVPAGTPNPGAGFKVKSAYKVIAGVQEYTCLTNPDGTGTWSTPTSTPEAVLLAYGSLRLIYHFAGPRWRALDGSTLVAAVAERVARDGTIPWLLLNVTAHENSRPGLELDPVTHISRVNTSGGVGPTGACQPGESRRVRYGADYVFWVPA